MRVNINIICTNVFANFLSFVCFPLKTKNNINFHYIDGPVTKNICFLFIVSCVLKVGPSPEGIFHAPAESRNFYITRT